MITRTFYKLFLFLIICTAFSCKHSAVITITSTVDSLDGTLVRVINDDFTITYDSTVVKNNSFKINVELPENGFYRLDFSSKIPYKNYPWMHGCSFYAEDRSTYVFKATGPAQILQNRYDLSSSSADQSKLNEFNSLAKRITDTVKHQRLYYINLSDDALLKNKDALYRKYLDTITQMDECINNANLAAIHQFIVKNPNTLITPYLITNVYDLFERYAFYKKVLDGLSPAVKQTKYYNEANELLQSVKNIYIGAEASPINGKTLKGDDFKISYANKKIILVDFWASYCAPCRQQTPDLKVIYNKYKSKGFDIVSVSIDEDAMKWKRASAQDSIPWHNVAECVDQSDSKNIRNFVVKSIPANYVLNNKGRLIGRNVELDSLERMLKKL